MTISTFMGRSVLHETSSRSRREPARKKEADCLISCLVRQRDTKRATRGSRRRSFRNRHAAPHTVVDDLRTSSALKGLAHAKVIMDDRDD